jgi:iron complex outermembrane recepter protein
MQNQEFSMRSLILFLLTIVLLVSPVIAQDDIVNDLWTLSLEDLLNIDVSVASCKGLSIRESPGIISVVTREDIVNSGARDLQDALRLVPGFEFGMDVTGVTGIGLRGFWGIEGKILVMVDGQELNELLYSTFWIGNHILLDQVEKIEIIRGPGSAIYGGFAEVAVINVITKSAEEVNGFQASGHYGMMQDSYARCGGSVSFGKKYKNFSIVAHTYFSQGVRSDQDYTSIYGDSFNMKENSDQQPSQFNLALTYKGLEARILTDRYYMTYRDAFDVNYMEDDLPEEQCNQTIASLKYDYNLSEALTITPKYTFKHSLGYFSDVDIDSQRVAGLFIDPIADRHTIGVNAAYDFGENNNLVTGVDFYSESASSEDDPEFEPSYSNLALYVQSLFAFKVANVTVGARFENHNEFGASFVPRLAFTRVFDRLHTKLLYSDAFRAPAFLQLSLNKDLDPEKTKVVEFEVGYKLTEEIFFTANVFWMNIDNMITYRYDPDTEEEGYSNYENVTNIGMELEYKIRQNWGYAAVNYSYYTVQENNVELYSAADLTDNALLAFPNNKINLIASFRLNKDITINPTLTFLGTRYGYRTVKWITDEIPLSILEEFDPITLLNLYINYNNLISEGLSLGVGVYDLLGADYEYIQPYNSYHAPLPGTTREIFVRLGYNF